MSMRKSILFIILLFTITSAMSQNFDRVEVKGRILVDANDVEGVTVYNTSSNKGTITDENGEFKITVAINDFIEFSALQFEDFSLTIDDDILKSKTLTVFLIERINKLNEVVILPFGLSGNYLKTWNVLKHIIPIWMPFILVFLILQPTNLVMIIKVKS